MCNVFVSFVGLSVLNTNGGKDCHEIIGAVASTLLKTLEKTWENNLLKVERDTWVTTWIDWGLTSTVSPQKLTLELRSFRLILFLCHTHIHPPALLSDRGRVDPSLSPGLAPSHRRPALAVCWCKMARWDAEGCRGGLWCQSPTARARAGVALPDSSWAARTMRARSWKTAWGQTWSYMRTTKTQTRCDICFL